MEDLNISIIPTIESLVKPLLGATGVLCRSMAPQRSREMEDVYLRAEQLLLARLGRRKNLSACLRLGMWLIRQHGPYGEGRAFAVPRYELAANERFAAQVGLTYSQIRTATEALEAIGLLERRGSTLKRNMAGRFKGHCKDTPVQYAIGPEFAVLFRKPNQQGKSPLVQNRERVLFVATSSKPVPRPIRMAPRPTEKSLYLAKLETLAAQPLPMLSALARKTMTQQMRW